MKYNISITRVLAMTMVVIFHCYLFYTPEFDRWGGDSITIYYQFCNLLNYIDIPAFVIISGYLFAEGFFSGKYSDERAFFSNKSKRLLLPYLFWGCVMLVFQPEVYQPNLFLYGFHHLWFLCMLFIQFVVFYLTMRFWNGVKFLSKWVYSIILYSLLLTIGIIIFRSKIVPGYFALPSTFRYLSLFYLGIIVVKFKLLKNFKTVSLSILVASICIFLIIAVLLFMGGAFISYIGTIVFQHVGSIIVLIMLFVLKNLTLKMPGGGDKIISLLDKNSMGVYCIHHILLFFAFSKNQYSNWMNEHIISGPIFTFLWVFTASLLISELIHLTKLKCVC